MIRNSFIFLDKIGSKREKQIWNQGIDGWDDFLNKNILGISRYRKPFYDRQILKARENLYNDNSLYFTKVLPLSEYWRLYNYFKEDAVFLDIETCSYYGMVTVVGLFDGIETKTMIRGINLDKDVLKKEFQKYKLIITFNGLSYDVPVLNKYFGNIIPEIPHIDLRHVCSKIGLKGGLKVIEEIIGIKRPALLRNYNGDDAAMLWDMYFATGKEKYLNLLVEYNEEDIINLKPIAEHAIKELWKKIKNDL